MRFGTPARRRSAGPPRRIPLIVAAAFFMEMLDGTIIATSLPAIAHDLDVPTLDVTASVTVYLVAATALVPTAGWASGRFGARPVFAGAIAVFTVASLLCAISPSFWPLIFARALQGAAAAYMSPVGRLIVLAETPKQHIIGAIGLIVWPGLIAPVVGPPLGGFITTYASWRWIFLINLPLGLLGTFLVLRFVPHRTERSRAAFDARGFALTALALATLIYGFALVARAREDLVAGGTLVVVGVVLGAAAIRHSRHHPAPMLDLAPVAIRTFALSAVSAGFVARVAISMTPFLLPLMFQIGFGLSAFDAGMLLLVYMAGNLAMKSMTTRVLHRFGFRDVILVNGLLCVASLIGCALLRPDLPLPLVYGILFVAGLTRSMNFTSMGTLAFADVPAALRPSATALAAMTQQAAGALGVAAAALLLGVVQSVRTDTALALIDFRSALLASAALMAVAVGWALRLPRDAGAELSARP